MCVCRSPWPETFACVACASHASSARPPTPRGPCVEATQRLSVWPTQGLLLLYNSTIGTVQQPQGLLLLYNSTIVAAQQARHRPGNIRYDTKRVGKPSFGLELCPIRAVRLSMPPVCLDGQKTQKSVSNRTNPPLSGRGPPRALIPRGCDALRGCAKRSLHCPTTARRCNR